MLALLKHRRIERAGHAHSRTDNHRGTDPSLAARFVSFFGVLALTLACVGLYGTIAQTVVRRTNEIGVRMALGAGHHDVLWMILRQTLILLVTGLAVGIPRRSLRRAWWPTSSSDCMPPTLCRLRLPSRRSRPSRSLPVSCPRAARHGSIRSPRFVQSDLDSTTEDTKFTENNRSFSMCSSFNALRTTLSLSPLERLGTTLSLSRGRSLDTPLVVSLSNHEQDGSSFRLR
jgi:FtsX-like permease family protein